jgi:hypothetical protein
MATCDPPLGNNLGNKLSETEKPSEAEVLVNKGSVK